MYEALDSILFTAEREGRWVDRTGREGKGEGKGERSEERKEARGNLSS